MDVNSAARSIIAVALAVATAVTAAAVASPTAGATRAIESVIVPGPPPGASDVPGSGPTCCIGT